MKVALYADETLHLDLEAIARGLTSISGFIQEFVRRGLPVIPVILPTCGTIPELPIFLRQFMWVDLRKERPDPLQMLKWGITGKKAV